MSPQSSNLIRLALGRGGSLGLLYDARSDKLIVSESILKAKPPADAFDLTENPSVKLEFTSQDSLPEKLSKLDVCGELSASLLCGLLDLTGSGKYLSNHKSSANVQSSSAICIVKTKHERLILGNDAIKDVLDLDTLANGDATHAITGIHWGGNCIVTAEADNSANLAGKWVEAMIKVSRKENANAKTQHQKSSNMKFTIAADSSLAGTLLVRNFDEAAEFIQAVPGDLKKPNNGKGVPLQYDLTCLATLTERFAHGTRCKWVTPPLKEDRLAQFVSLFRRIEDVKQHLNAYLEDVTAHHKCVPKTQVDKARKQINKFRMMESELKRTLQEMLVYMRRRIRDDSNLLYLLQCYEKDERAPEAYCSILSEYRDKMKMEDWFLKNAVTYTNDAPSDLEKLVMFTEGDQFVLYFNEETRSGDVWEKTYALFHELVVSKRNNTYKLTVVDCDVGNVAKPRKLKKPLIEKRRDGKIIIPDVLVDVQALAGKSILRCKDSTMIQTSRAIPPPPGRRVVRVFCPGKHCSDMERLEWVCPDCKQVVCFGHELAPGKWDDSLYCECGRYPVSEGQFKCNNPDHGAEYCSFSHTSDLIGLLQNLDVSDECNILILSEKGVDKPTFINALWNYLLFPSLDNALASSGSLKTAIPSSFSYGGHAVQVGGESALAETKSSTNHVLSVKNRILRLIDIAAIDKFENSALDAHAANDIISQLRSIDRLDAVLFLLRPNTTSLTEMFKFSMKVLLSNLELDNNLDRHVMFGFTSSKETRFSLWDTKVPLSSLLQTTGVNLSLGYGNTFFFDEEGFKFFAAHKVEKVQMTIKEAFDDGWTRSAKDARRLIREITRLPPLNVLEALFMGRIRQVIIGMAKPMIQISIAGRETEERLLLSKNMPRHLRTEGDEPQKYRLRRLVEEFRKENMAAKEALISLATYLKKDEIGSVNTMAAYKAATLEYLNHLIHDAEMHGRGIVLMQLNNVLSEYEAQLKEVAKEVNTGKRNVPRHCEIDDIISRLCQMKHFGSDFKKAISPEVQVHADHVTAEPEIHVPIIDAISPSTQMAVREPSSPTESAPIPTPQTSRSPSEFSYHPEEPTDQGGDWRGLA